MPAASRVPPTGDLPIPPSRGLPAGLTVPAAELTERFSRSSGPGGQSVNTADSRVSLSWDIGTSPVLSDSQRERLLDRLGARLVDGVLTLSASEQRAQLANRQAARARLATLIVTALTPDTVRRATRPSRAARERRLAGKQRRSDVKSGRGRIRPD